MYFTHDFVISSYCVIHSKIPQTLHQLDVSARTIVCTYSIYKEAPEDGPLRSETCRADT